MLPSKRIFSVFITTLIFLTLFALTGYAQFRAGVQGTVSDNSGAAVAGASVTLTNKETNLSQKTQTSDEGFYRFSNLAPGLYSVAVEQQGFKKRLVNDVRVEAEALRGQDVTLDAGVITETVTVESDALALQTEDANVRRTISTDEIQRLPQAGRDPFELVRLAPGVFGSGARSGNGSSVYLPNTSGPGGSNSSIFATENAQPISANGQRVSANNYQIDGTSVNSQTWGGAAVITPSQESVKEVQVTSTTYSAEDGRNSGAQVRVVSQNGTNQWHGSAFYKVDDPALNAFNKFYGVPGVVVAKPTRVQRKFKTYGGSFGGHIVKDKLFFFFSYEGLKENTSNTVNTVVETAAYRQAVINARPNSLTAKILGAPGIQPNILSVLGGTCATAGINIPCQVVGNGFDVGSLTGSYGSYVSLGSPSGGGFDGIADLQYVQLGIPKTFNGNQYFTRVDYQFSAKDKFAVSSYIVPSRSLGSDSSSQARSIADVNSKRKSYALGFIYDRTISNTTVNEARFNITNWGFNEVASNPNANLGLPRVEVEGIFGDRLRFGFPQGQNTPGIINERQLDFRDIVTKIIGNHVFKVGGEYRRDANSNGEVGASRPLFSISGLWNLANGTPIFESITADSSGKPTANNTKFNTSELAFFVQDDWKFRPNLTLNLGLRWSEYSPIQATNGVLGNLVLDSNGGLAGAKISTAKNLYHRDLNNFGPQLGFAWSPERFDNKMVLRGGGGIGYDRLPNALLANARRNPPNGQNFGICCGTASTDFGTPFVGGQIAFVGSSDGTITGYPANPKLGGGTNPANGLPLNGSIEIYGAPQNLPTAYVYRYSLEGEYQLPKNIIATLGYVGSSGHKFVRILPLHITGPSTNPNIGAAYFASPDVNSNYNAMIARLQGRFMKQVSFDVNYRFAKSIDTASFEAPTALTNQSFPVDQREERGLSDFDVKHNITATVLWDIPFFNHSNGWKAKVLGGWQINAIATHNSGFPFTPKLFGCLLGTTTNNFCDPRPTRYSGKPALDNSNENFLKPGGIFPGGGAAYFSTSVPFNANPFANKPGIGRNTFRGPRYSDLDMAFAKQFGLPNYGFLGESAKLDIRFNFFNILNTLNLTPFNSNTDPTRVTLAAFGTATSALAGRTGEFQIRFSF